MLFQPKWYSKKDSKAAEAVNKLQNPEKLRSIVKDERANLYARLTAAKQLEDDEMLLWLDQHTNDSLTRQRVSDELYARKQKREEAEQLAVLAQTNDLGTILKLYYDNPTGYGLVRRGSVQVRSLANSRMSEFSEEEYCRFIIETPIRDTALQELALKQISSDELLDKIADAILSFEITDPKNKEEEQSLYLSKWAAEKLQKTAREKAAEIRFNSICNGQHDWELVSREDAELGEGGDYRLVYEIRRCRRCGETKGEYFWPNGTPFVKPRKR